MAAKAGPPVDMRQTLFRSVKLQAACLRRLWLLRLIFRIACQSVAA